MATTLSHMHELGLIASERKEPFFNLGGHPVSTFQDISVDGLALLPEVERAVGEHFDVVTALTSEFPSGAVEFLDNMLGAGDMWRISMGATEPGEVPIYICPVDYDLLCGGIVATVVRTDERVRIHQFRHTSTDDEYSSRVAPRLSALDFDFDRHEFDQVLLAARAGFAEEARTWVQPEWRISAVRRLARRVRRSLRR